jgi:glycosyltransferase involved in cell wall biosynthesis
MVVNGSSDGSRKIGDELSAREPQSIKVVEFPEPGRGRALKRYWQQSSADIVAYMDADLAVALDDIPLLVGPIISGEADLVFGSRLLKNSKTERSFIRELTSRSYILLSRLILGHKFSDVQCGFKAVRRPAFAKVAPYITGDFWFFDTELIMLAKLFGYRLKEIPVDWRENRFGKRATKVKLIGDSITFFRNLWPLRRRLKKIKKTIPTEN